MEEQPT